MSSEMTQTKSVTLTIDGETANYVREDSIPKQQAPSGPLSIVVLTAGWIFVGRWDGTAITEAQNVRYFKKVGFGGLTQGAKHAGATLDDSRDITPNSSAILFTAPLPEGWHNA